MPRKPIIPLPGFLKRWLDDATRFKIAVKSRRIGFTFGTTLEIALDAIGRKTRWLIVSRTEETAKEALRECARHLAAMKIAAKDLAIRPEDTEFLVEGVRVKVFIIELPNGSEVRAMTAHPDAVRGFGGNILLDEFGFHRDSFELWKAAIGAVARGHRLVVVSTPNFQQGKYFEIARDCGLVDGTIAGEWREKRGMWSCHFVDAEAAEPQLKAIGVPFDVREMRELAGDEESFLQEFMGKFLSAAEQWIPLELIANARSPLANADWDPDREYSGPLYAGVDLARKRDLFSAYIWEQGGGGQDALRICRGIIRRRGIRFAEMEDIICALAAHPKMVRVCVDETGMGGPVVEHCQSRVGGKVEGVTFTMETKETMARGTKEAYEKALHRIPENDAAFEKAVQAVKRIATATGGLRFDAARTDAGHADEFWAQALADNAAANIGYVPCSELGVGGRTICGNLREMVF